MAVAPRFWKRETTRRQNDCSRMYVTVSGADRRCRSRDQIVDSRGGLQLDAGGVHFGEQRVDYVTRTIRIGKEFSVRLFVQWHAK